MGHKSSCNEKNENFLYCFSNIHPAISSRDKFIRLLLQLTSIQSVPLKVSCIKEID